MNEATARSMVVQATMPMALLAADGALLGASSPWERLLGTAPTLSALVAEADDESVRNVLSKGREGTFDVRLRADDSKWVKLQATRLADESALLVVATDVTTVHAELADLQDRIGFMEWQALSLSTFAKVIGSARVILFAMDAIGCDHHVRRQGARAPWPDARRARRPQRAGRDRWKARKRVPPAGACRRDAARPGRARRRRSPRHLVHAAEGRERSAGGRPWPLDRRNRPCPVREALGREDSRS